MKMYVYNCEVNKMTVASAPGLVTANLYVVAPDIKTAVRAIYERNQKDNMRITKIWSIKQEQKIDIVKLLREKRGDS